MEAARVIDYSVFMAHKREAAQKATIRDVARKAKVSTATVSRVLAGGTVVSEPLAARVRAVAKQLRYQPNRVARSLRSQKSHIVGVLIPNIQNPFFTGVIRGIEDLLQATDYTLLLGNSDDNPARERNYLELLKAEGVAGLIVVPGQDAAKTYDEILSLEIPLVAIDRFVADLPCDSVTVANAEGAAAAIRHLLALGHKRIAIATGPESISTARDRLTGYMRALQAARIPFDPVLVHHGMFRQEGGYEAALQLISLPSPPTAIFTASGSIALGVLRALHDRTVQIPRQMAMVSFDDMPWAAALSPPLTAVAQPMYELGAIAARLLLARVRDGDLPLQRVQLQTQLVVRASCGAPWPTAPD